MANPSFTWRTDPETSYSGTIYPSDSSTSYATYTMPDRPDNSYSSMFSMWDKVQKTGRFGWLAKQMYAVSTINAALKKLVLSNTEFNISKMAANPYINTTIEFNANDGTNTTVSAPYYGGSPPSFIMPLTPIGKRSGFLGWSTSPTATTATWKFGEDLIPICSSGQCPSNKTFYAVWSTTSYIITYNANGGTGGPTTQNTELTGAALIPNTVPTRSGYNFLGWSTSSTATTATYNPLTTYTFSGNTTLYAIWSAPYTVTFNANGGSVSPSSAQVNSSNMLSSLPTPTYSGYIFNGWFTAASGGTRVSTSTIYSANTTIYARWESVITYNANGGTGGPTTQSYLDSVTISSTVPTRDGYNFLGWSTSTSATLASYLAGGTYTLSFGSKTFYAVWQGKSLTISYNVNGGSGSLSSTSYTYPNYTYITSSIPTRSGYNFLGWSTSSTATTASYSSGSSYRSTSNTTLYAVWSQIVTYTLSYNMNGGSGSISSQTFSSGSSVTVSSYKPTRSGYEFKYWSNSSSGGSSYYGGSSYTFYNNVTLYAQWNRLYYTITLDPNGGTIVGSRSSFAPYENNSIQDEYTDRPTATKTGYTFNGWYDSSGYALSYSTVYNTSKTFTARYTANTNLITFNANGGTCTASSMSLSTGVQIGTLPIASRDGYDFLGWYDSITSGNKITTTSTFNANTTLYAQWEKLLQTFTVTFNVNGGSGAISSISCTENNSVTIPSTVPTRTDHTFLGWTDDITANNVICTAGNTYKPTKNTILYAVWRRAVSVITFDTNTGDVLAETTKKINRDDPIGTLPVPTKTDYTFTGWFTGKTDGVAVSESTKFDEDTTLYARWAKEIITITLDPGDGTVNAALRVELEKGTVYNLPLATKDGYSFLGWYDSDTLIPNTGYTFNKNTALVAKYRIITYTVTFDPDDGIMPEKDKTRIVEHNQPVGPLPRATKKFYRMTGWYDKN